jgi:hypothetical protein
MKNVFTSVALAFSLAAAPIATANAAPLRASAPISSEASALGGGEGGGLVLAIIIVAGIIGAILDQEDDSPDSP